MEKIALSTASLAYRDEGPKEGPPIVFANSLGTTMALWEPLLPHLPDGLRVIRYDMRGHGGSDMPDPPYSMGALVRDAEDLMDALELRDALFVGLSIGGLVAQGLATKRRDLMRGMVLSNTAAKIGTEKIWQSRIDAIRAGGLEAIADATMERWFTRTYRATPDLKTWRKLLTDTAPEGYIGCAQAISGTDFYTTTAALTLPTLVIAGSEDGATPADLVRETQGLIRGSQFQLIRRSGHLPCVEQPEAYAQALTRFMKEIGHI
ncbi:MAG: 3-oxoadipate enol-lactonase [Litoreibacter sp.]|nr:3-oxoadipate enol-lactonase [Litoreibacter sp.]